MCLSEKFADRLIQAVRVKETPACVGLDPQVPKLPPEILRRHRIDVDSPTIHPEATAQAFRDFGVGVIAAVAPHVPALKINIAFFEPLGAAGWMAYASLVAEAKQAGLIVIGDIKRADIGHSAAQYAAAHLVDSGDTDQPNRVAVDAVTINPYFGIDGARPFIDTARNNGRGVFVLVQTSNESAARVQGIVDESGRPLSHSIATMVGEWACDSGLIGTSGYSSVGAVVSPRDLESTRMIRKLMPRCIFLVPGFGAQGRTADEVALCFSDDGLGAIVNASRSVIYAFAHDRYKSAQQKSWQSYVEQACLDFSDAVRRARRH